MKDTLKTYLTVLLSIHIFTISFTSIKISGGLQGIVYAALIFWIIHFLARPALKVLLFPLNLLTINMSQWIMDIVIFFIWSLVTSSVVLSDLLFYGFTIGPISIGSFHLVYWQSIIVSGILLRLIIKLIHWLIE